MVQCCGFSLLPCCQSRSALTQHCADLIGQDGVGVVQPAASTKALLEAVEDGLIGEQHDQDPQSGRDRAGVKVLLHEHQEPIKTQRPNQLLTRSAGGRRSTNSING